MNSTSPAEFVRETLRKFPLHKNLDSSSLIDKMLAAPPNTDPWDLDLTEAERRLLGRILAENPDQPTIEEVKSALAWLGRRHLARHAEQLNRELRAAEARTSAQVSEDPHAIADLLLAKRLVRRAVRDLEEC
jgi:hypothetical protein